MEINSITLGERIKQLRLNHKLKQRELGSIIEVDGAFISKIEKNEKTINRNHLKTLSEYFNIEEKELQILWLVDKIKDLIRDEQFAKEAIGVIYNDL